MAKGLLKSGAKPAHGGRRPNSGRKPDWLKEKCQAIIDRKKVLEFLGRVVAGEEQEDRCTKDGDVFQVGVSTHDRLHAAEILFERGFGKPAQAVEVTGESGGPVVWNIKIVGVEPSA